MAAVHAALGRPKDEMTRRIIKAIEQPEVGIIAHPTGRLVGQREPYEVDMAWTRAGPTERRWRSTPTRNGWICRMSTAERPVEKGVKLAISTDAHHVEGLNLMQFGVATARRGWIEPEDVINTLSLDRFLEYLEKQHGPSPQPRKRVLTGRKPQGGFSGLSSHQ